MKNPNRNTADAWTGREQSRFQSTAPAAYLKLAANDGATPAPRLPTSVLLNI